MRAPRAAETPPRPLEPAPLSTQGAPAERIQAFGLDGLALGVASIGASVASLFDNQPRVLVDDDQAPGPGQMTRTTFLGRLRGPVQAACDGELGAVGRTVHDCPYLQRAFGEAEGRSTGDLERLLRRYVGQPAATADALIAAVVRRAVIATRQWAQTGAMDPAVNALGPVLFKADGPRSAPPGVVRASLGAGRPLEPSTRGRMESAFGVPLAHVRLHDDAHAAASARDLDARAFTIGSHVAFGAGEYRPGTLVGDALLAHEIAHTFQQAGGAGPTRGEAELERDADHAAVHAAGRAWGMAPAQTIQVAASGGLRLQRCGKSSGPTPTTPLPSGSATPSGSVSHTSGAQLDTYLSGSAAISAFVKTQIAGGRVATGHIHFFNDADFRRVCVAYLQRHANSSTGAAYTQAEAEAYEPSVNAYQEGADVYIAENRGTASTAVHEGIHLYESDTFLAGAGWDVSEGVTEWLTRMVIAEQSLGFVRTNYASQHTAVTRLVAKAGQAAVLDAYFNGNMAGLRTATDTATSTGTFDKWVTFMQAQQFTKANALM